MKNAKKNLLNLRELGELRGEKKLTAKSAKGAKKNLLNLRDLSELCGEKKLTAKSARKNLKE